MGYSLSSLYGNGYDGTGQKVAIVDVPGDPNIQTTINTYSAQYGLSQTTLDIRYPDGLPSLYDSGWAVETALDVEAVHTVAPGATIVLLYDQINLMNALEYVAANHLATVVSNSWVYSCVSGACSDTQLPSSWVSSVDSRLAVLAAQGLTLLFASGDNGAKPDGANFGTEFPASDPNVLAVGGTNLVLSGCGYTTCSGYTSETGASIGGGGYSRYFAEPSWQTSTIGIKPGRAVPDVSMLGQSPHFWTYLTGSGWFGVYGTSLSTPLWAGFLAIALQIKGVGSLGNLGPILYQVASSSAYSSLFHDVISGSNGYSAGSGWDPVTGWGTPIANALAAILANSPPTMTSFSSDKPSPQPVGVSIVWTCSASDAESDPLSYRFWLQAGSNQWTVTQDWSSANMWNWTPNAAGTYNVGCWVRDGKHAPSTSFDARLIVNGYVITSGPPNGPPIVSSLTPDKASPQVAGTMITWTCSATDPEGDPISYRFWLQAGSSAWVITQDWSGVNTWSWTPSVAGTYNVGCWVRDGKHAPSSSYDARLIVNGYVVTSGPPNGPPSVTAFSPDKVSPQVVGTTITWTCSATDPEGDPIVYRFWLQSGSGAWSILQDWSSSNVWTWTPTAAGTYNVGCWVRDGKHADSSSYDARMIVNGYVITLYPA